MGTYSSEFHRRTPDIIVYLYVLKEAKGNRIVLSLSIEPRLLVDALLAAVNRELRRGITCLYIQDPKFPWGILFSHKVKTLRSTGA